MDGDNTILIGEGVKDGANNPAEPVTIQIRLDRTAPVIHVKTQLPALTNQQSWVVEYTVDNETTVRTQNVTLVDGDNTILIGEEVKDDANNPAVPVTIQVRLDRTAPVIVLPEGLDGSSTNKSPLQVIYRVDGVEKTATFDLSSADGGVNHLSVTETDEAGNSSTVNFTVTLDTTAPVVELVGDLPDIVSASEISVNYRVDGVDRQIVLPLAEGDNSDLKLTAMDAAGNETVFRLPNIRYVKPPIEPEPNSNKSVTPGQYSQNSDEDSKAKTKATAINPADFSRYFLTLHLSSMQRKVVTRALGQIRIGTFVHRYETSSGPSFSWMQSDGRAKVFSFEYGTLLFGELLIPTL